MRSSKKDRLLLHIYHCVFLSREERYRLADGEAVEVVGVNLPVWSSSNDTSEPAVELFCKYVLNNQPGRTSIMPFGEGYLVNIPQPLLNPTSQETLSNEEWRAMSLVQMERKKARTGRDPLEEWYDKQQRPKTGRGLRDIQDGGSAYLRFAETRRMQRNGKAVTLYHMMEIQDVQEMLDTLSS